MTKPSNILALILLNFLTLSLVAFGGANSVTPDIHDLIVDQYHLMSAQRFADYFTIAQAAPGPNLLLTTLIGWDFAGLKGALLATISFILLPGILIFLLVKTWDRYENKPFVHRIKATIQPITLGFLVASAYLVFNSTPSSWIHFGVMIVAFALSFLTRIHPFTLIFGAIVIGFLKIG